MSESLTLICVHGVGMWPWLFDRLHLDVDRRVWTRPGYEAVPSVANFERQVDCLEQLVAEQPSVVFGVSGGATLALACAIRRPDRLIGVVTHEPLVGALEPELDAHVAQGAARLRRAPGEPPALAFLAGLYGVVSVRAMPDFARWWAREHAAVICREVADFASFQPTLHELERIDVPHLTTVGARSGASRHRIATLLGSVGASTSIVEGAGHLVHVDNPVGTSARLQSFCSELVG